MNIQDYAKIYRDNLLEDVIPFWLDHSEDKDFEDFLPAWIIKGIFTTQISLYGYSVGRCGALQCCITR